MENPDSWGPAEHTVNRVLHERQVNRERPVEEHRFGLSLVRLITDALRAEGLLVEGSGQALHDAWVRGMNTGTSRAMRHMSDEPGLALASEADSPYWSEVQE